MLTRVSRQKGRRWKCVWVEGAEVRSEVLRARCERRYQRKAPLLFPVHSCWLWLLGKTPGEADLRQSPWQRRGIVWLPPCAECTYSDWMIRNRGKLEKDKRKIKWLAKVGCSAAFFYRVVQLQDTQNGSHSWFQKDTVCVVFRVQQSCLLHLSLDKGDPVEFVLKTTGWFRLEWTSKTIKLQPHCHGQLPPTRSVCPRYHAVQCITHCYV